jgi:hypothetical protein
VTYYPLRVVLVAAGILGEPLEALCNHIEGPRVDKLTGQDLSLLVCEADDNIMPQDLCALLQVPQGSTYKQGRAEVRV